MPAEEQGAPKLHIDADWKASARAEKERLKEKQETREAASDKDLPPATFASLLELLASQAVMGLGAYADRQTGRVVIDLPGAKFAIDMLQVLEEKTKGNLATDESTHLKQILAELRSRFVQIVQLIAQQGGQPQQPQPSEQASPGIVAP